MDKNKKKVITIIVMILVVFGLLTVLLSYLLPQKTVEKPNKNPDSININVSKKIEILKDQELFFGIQKIINNFYEKIQYKETENILNILSDEYIKEKNINKNNVFSYLKSDYQIVSYTPKIVYYNSNSSVTYYFVNGYLMDIPFDEENSIYYDNINFLIIVDSSNNYQIMPFESSNILNYANNYNIQYKEINNNFYFNKNIISEETKLTIYLNEFINLLIYKPDKAYNMLNDETKNKYLSYTDFENQIINIYEKYSTEIFSYASNEKNNKTEYTIIDDNQNTIKITEYNIMDFKIGF